MQDLMTVGAGSRIAVTCVCGVEFTVTKSRFEAGRGKFCSRECKYKNVTRRSGLTYNLTRKNPTSFKPGQDPWNKGLRGVHFSPGTEFKPGERRSPGTEFQPGQTAGEANFKWAGEDVGYWGLHQRVYKERGPAASYPCSSADVTCKGPMHWANVSGEYLGVEDFVPMCQSHHFRHDRRRAN